MVIKITQSRSRFGIERCRGAGGEGSGVPVPDGGVPGSGTARAVMGQEAMGTKANPGNSHGM